MLRPWPEKMAVDDQRCPNAGGPPLVKEGRLWYNIGLKPGAVWLRENVAP